MNKLFYNISNLELILPIKILIHLSGQKVIFPFYHSVSDVVKLHIKHLYKVRSPAEFERDLDYLLKHFKPLSLEEFLDFINGNVIIKKKAFLLSFDDGLKEFHDIIAPILKRKGIPAINFLNSAFIDNKDLFFRYKESILVEKCLSNNFLKKKVKQWLLDKKLPAGNISNSILSIPYSNKQYLDDLASILEVNFQDYLNINQPYLNSDQINSLIAQGFIFGAHSIDHPLYSELELSQQLYQTQASIQKITSKFNLKYKIFSFPFTDYNVSKIFFDQIFHEKTPLADLTFGCAGLKLDSCQKNIQRIPIEIADFSAHHVIYGEYLYFILKSFLNKNRIQRR
jgi:peptidoglycan/xylan/chitin deacetylase (PgdA/CDA1 family)